jgi:protein required for attachment to host cells
MAKVGPQTGHKMKLYRNSGTHATPTWGLVSQVEDVSIPDMARGLAELKRRASDFTKNLPS